MRYDAIQLREELTSEQIFEILNELGAEPIQQNGQIVCKTICHNPSHSHCSHKLYYYENSHLFNCYTSCDDVFDIFELVQRHYKVENHQKISFSQSLEYVANFFNIVPDTDLNFDEQDLLEDEQIFSSREKVQKIDIRNQEAQLKVYDDKILKRLPHPIIAPWQREGIKREILKAYQIAYDPKECVVIIPHYDINNNLVGIRGRTMVQEDERYGKYRPANLNGIMYNHPLSLNLYGINLAKKNIQSFKKAIVFEGEKSPMLYGSFFGLDNNIAVAMCGSSFSAYQARLLIDKLGVQEIILAFDKQYQRPGTAEYDQWRKKIEKIGNKYKNETEVSVIMDFQNKLDYKDSPIDKGQKIFLELLKRREFL